VASADSDLRLRLRRSLTDLRWTVRECAGGADALHQLDLWRPEALLLDSWLPDLEVEEVAGQVRSSYPTVDLLRVDGQVETTGARSPRRHELMHALREAQGEARPGSSVPVPITASSRQMIGGLSSVVSDLTVSDLEIERRTAAFASPGQPVAIPELVGKSEPMIELARLIRLVAPRSATVLIEGETGTGKEVVAKALHRLSARAAKSFVVLNCAAIPETLLEAELFGHTRGAFTGATQSRTGRIEAAHGGTLFLDEIGEMPLALQAKMLRFLEAGELQRVGDNETIRVDVRVIAATHQPLERRSEERAFRLDLYHRLAVFPIGVPALRERAEDIPLLVEHFLEVMGLEMPRKRIQPEALEILRAYHWPGNVRELMHVIERAVILAGERPELGVDEVRLRRRPR
jgi:transcriptional regulator with GAF, ATPase, and Fis domain